MTATIPDYQITIGKENVETDVLNLVVKIRPDWISENLELKVFTGGLSNRLFGIYQKTDHNQLDMVLVRIFGESTHLFVNREMELKTMKILVENNRAKPIYCTFKNGFSYGHIPGIAYDHKLLAQDPFYANLVAKEMARLHTIPVPEDYSTEQNSSFFKSFHQILKLLPKSLPNEDDNTRYQKEVFSSDILQKEATVLEQIAESFNEKLIICHHDLLPANILLLPDGESARFIDFEFAGLGYRQVEIATFFIAYLDMANPSADLFPSKQHQILFLKTYLEEVYRYEKKTSPVKDADVEELYNQVQKMIQMSYLYWGVWCVLQKVLVSEIPFDFLGLGIYLMKEYFRLKSVE